MLVVTAGGSAKKKELGLGHIFRTINLVQNIKAANVFFLVEDYGGAKEIIKKFGFKFLVQEKDLNLSSRIKLALIYRKKLKIDVMIIDRYKIEKQFVASMRRFTKTIIIADVKNKDFDADIVVNGFIGFKNTIIKNKFGAKCLLGPRYQILNKNFSSFKNDVKRKSFLLATFGGFDENNLAEFLLETLFQTGKKIQTKIVLGPATKKTKRMIFLSKKMNKYVNIIDKTYDMSNEMFGAQFGICSGGITSYEFAARNIPFAIICQVPHQLFAAREWQKRGIGINLGVFNHKIKNSLKKFIMNFDFQSIKRPKRRLVDGRGSMRVAEEIMKLYQSDQLRRDNSFMR